MARHCVPPRGSGLRGGSGRDAAFHMIIYTGVLQRRQHTPPAHAAPARPRPRRGAVDGGGGGEARVRTKSMKVAGKWKSVRLLLPTTGGVAANLVHLWESRFQLEQQGERQKWELGMELEPRGPFQNHSRPLCFIKSLHHNFRLAVGIFQRSPRGRRAPWGPRGRNGYW